MQYPPEPEFGVGGLKCSAEHPHIFIPEGIACIGGHWEMQENREQDAELWLS